MGYISTIAVSGLQAASVKLANAANNIVNAESEGYVPTDTVQSPLNGGGVKVSLVERPDAVSPVSGLPNIDITEEIVDSAVAAQAYEASAAIIGVDKDLHEVLLDSVDGKDE